MFRKLINKVNPFKKKEELEKLEPETSGLKKRYIVFRKHKHGFTILGIFKKKGNAVRFVLNGQCQEIYTDY